jgi:uncharacterized protein (DUF169 family)
MSRFSSLYQQFLGAFEDDSLRIPCCGLKFVKSGETDPVEQFSRSPKWLDPFPRSLASCGYSYKASRSGWTLRVTAANIGCPAGAMSLGLVATDSRQPFNHGCYVQNMERPAVPADFTAGFVYAPAQSGHPEFKLFGEEDCGRYETLEAARKAVAGMPVIPAVMQAVYYYHPDWSEVEIEPDLVHLYCTPLQAMRLITGYCYPTGERFNMSCIGIRGVSCDMTAWPYVHDDINGTFLCLGARAITGWEEQYVGFGMPLRKFEEVIVGMQKSRRGFPYAAFPKMTDGGSEEDRMGQL